MIEVTLSRDCGPMVTFASWGDDDEDDVPWSPRKTRLRF